jgi:YbbR domain-containing protein
MPVVVEVEDEDSLSTAYEVAEAPEPRPDTVVVLGPGPYVEQVAEVRAVVSLPNAPTEVRETLPVEALDKEGRRVAEVSLQPDQVRVTASIKGRSNTRDVSVRTVVSGTPPAEYQVSGISVTPSSVTLRSEDGAPLGEVGSYVDTLPIEIGGVTSDLRVEMPLDLPAGVQALDGNGSPVSTVMALVDISVREGAMSLTRPVEVLGMPTPPNPSEDAPAAAAGGSEEGAPAAATGGEEDASAAATGGEEGGATGGSSVTTLTLDPEVVTLLLIGPQPILNEIENNPSLVRVAVDLSRVGEDGEVAVLEPIISAPEEVEVEVVPETIRATVQLAGGD